MNISSLIDLARIFQYFFESGGAASHMLCLLFATTCVENMNWKMLQAPNWIHFCSFWSFLVKHPCHLSSGWQCGAGVDFSMPVSPPSHTIPRCWSLLQFILWKSPELFCLLDFYHYVKRWLSTCSMNSMSCTILQICPTLKILVLPSHLYKSGINGKCGNFLKIIITIVKKKPCYKILSSYYILPSVIMQSIPNEKKKTKIKWKWAKCKLEKAAFQRLMCC